MALAEICKLDSVLKRKDITAEHSDMMLDQCCNIDNSYQLAMPPFENVSFIDFFQLFMVKIDL